MSETSSEVVFGIGQIARFLILTSRTVPDKFFHFFENRYSEFKSEYKVVKVVLPSATKIESVTQVVGLKSFGGFCPKSVFEFSKWCFKVSQG